LFIPLKSAGEDRVLMAIKPYGAHPQDLAPATRPNRGSKSASEKRHEHISAPGSQSNSKTVVFNHHPCELKVIDRVGYWRLAVTFANGFRIRVLHSRKTVRSVKMSKNLAVRACHRPGKFVYIQE
jgi:hypothetical protein